MVRKQDAFGLEEAEPNISSAMSGLAADYILTSLQTMPHTPLSLHLFNPRSSLLFLHMTMFSSVDTSTNLVVSKVMV